MKKYLLLSVVSVLLAMTLLLCACSRGGTQPTTDASTTPHDNEESYSVAILQYDNDYASNAMREAFIARMRTLGYDEAKMKFDILSAHADGNSLSTNAQSLLESKYKLIVAVGTLAAKAVAQTENTIPCVFIGANDPVGNGLTTSLEIPDRNMTGSAFRSSAETILSVMRVYTPNISKVAVLYSDTGKTEAEAVSATLTDNAYTVTSEYVTSADGLLTKVGALAEGVDAFYIPDDPISDEAAKAIINTANEHHTVVFSSNEGLISAGALMGAFTDSKELAEQAALRCDRLIQGELIAEISIPDNIDISLFVNRQSAELYEIETPTSDNLVLM